MKNKIIDIKLSKEIIQFFIKNSGKKISVQNSKNQIIKLIKTKKSFNTNTFILTLEALKKENLIKISHNFIEIKSDFFFKGNYLSKS